MPSAAKKSIAIQDRDRLLLRGLFESRLMTLAHAAAINFEGRAEAAKKRIQKLKAAGLIRERLRKAYEPSILQLTKDGYDLLHQDGLLNDFPELSWKAVEKRLHVSDLTLRHELQVMDVKAAFHLAIQPHPALSVEEFSTWPILNQFEACPGAGLDVLVKPDGFIRIHQQGPDGAFEHMFFLEVDRSTETLETLCRKAQCYLNYYQRGGLAERLGASPSQYAEYPFRVLMIFKTSERRNNVAGQLLAQHPPILTHTWLSTFREVVANPLAPVWIKPRDFREANVSVAPTSPRRREVLDSSLAKHSLFED